MKVTPENHSPLPPKTSERLLMEAWPRLVAGREPAGVLCTSTGRAQLGRFVAEHLPTCDVTCVYHDLYQAELALDCVRGTPPPNLSIACRADLVEPREATPAAARGFDVAALPLTAQGDGELAREQLQQAYATLPAGGLLIATTDNPRDTWLGEQITALAGRPKRIEAEDGATYFIERSDGPVRMRNFECRFAFRDAGRLFKVTSRPGVFSHRRIDPGARRLIDAMEIGDCERVLDIGCGWGAVGLAAAARGPNVTVEALDSNARAVACTAANAARNGLAGQIAVRLEAGGRTRGPGTFDVALGNPPYYADFRIAELFLRAAAEALRPGGRLLMVTKDPERYFEVLEAEFTAITAEEIKGYVVILAVRK